MDTIIILICLFFIVWAINWRDLYNDRTPFITNYDWWRNNHYYSKKDSFLMMLRADIYWPFQNMYSWIWLKVNYRWGKCSWSKMYRLRKQCQELELELFE